MAAAVCFGALRGPTDTPKTVEHMDLELRLGPPSVSPQEPKSGGTAVCLDLVLFAGSWKPAEQESRSLRAAISLGPSADPRKPTGNQETDEEEEATEPASKRVKTEQQMTGANMPAPLLVQPLRAVDNTGISADPRKPTGNQEEATEPASKRVKAEQPDPLVQPLRALPPAARHAPRSPRRKLNLHPPATNHGAAGAAEPAWVRAELFRRHGLPEDLPLHFVEEKLLQPSDVSSQQTRFLIPLDASNRLRTVLSPEEIEACGLDSPDGRRTASEVENEQRHNGEKKRASPTRYVGVPVSVYERGGGWKVSKLRLNKFRTSQATVINGRGYTELIARSGFEKWDRVEVWAFRRPSQHLCFVIAKKDDNQAAGA